MKKFSLTRPHKKSLHKKQLGSWWFYHGSMFGTFRTPCYIIDDIGNGTVVIEFFDGYINDWSTQEIERSSLMWS